MKNKNWQQQLLISSLYITLPILIGLLTSIWIKASIFSIIAVIYGIMLIFMIPSDVFFSSSIDYRTKAINPSYKPQKPDFIGETVQQIIHFSLVAVGLVICLFLMLLN